MERFEIDFLELEREVIRFISQNTTWVLATGSGNHVTARSIFTVSNGLVFFFQTDKNFLKYKQITIWKHTDKQTYRDMLMIFSKKDYRENYIGHSL